MSLSAFIIAAVPHPWISAVILLTLCVIFTASWMMFWLLVERSTDQREQAAMTDWGKERGFRSREFPEGQAPPPFNVALHRHMAVRASFQGKKAWLMKLATFDSTDDPAPARAGVWHVLIIDIGAEWPPTGLRPVAAARSVLDLFSLTSFPLLGNSERFVVYGAGSHAAAALAGSAARGLLPADIGLLLHGHRLVLDFSSRPFDTIEFERMIVVAQQVAGHLPASQGGE